LENIEYKMENARRTNDYRDSLKRENLHSWNWKWNKGSISKRKKRVWNSNITKKDLKYHHWKQIASRRNQVMFKYIKERQKNDKSSNKVEIETKRKI
jgi:hypothetical protein